MAVKHARLGDGTLTLGTTPLDVSAQVVACVLESEVETGDSITVLNGESLQSGLSTSAVLSGTLILDPYSGGVGEWTWTNHGTEQTFVFTPNTDAGLSITGVVLVVKLAIGSDAYGNVMQSEFEWSVVGEPVPTWGTAPVA